MRKEVRPTMEDAACEVCGRTILKGERTEIYLAQNRQRKRVCELCFARADHVGWIRESAHGDLPATLGRAEPRRSLLGRLRRRREEEIAEPLPAAPEPYGEEAEYALEAPAPGDLEQANGDSPAQPMTSRPKDPRHVRAVPTNAEVKVERALELFNASEHRRTVGGIARSLGEPWVRAAPSVEAPSEVWIVVAWELSWYRYRVDLGDGQEPVGLVDKGQELMELPDEARAWNGSADADGQLYVGVGSEP